MADFVIAPAALERWINDLFTAAGSSAREAALVGDHLVQANLTGHDSHGVGMVPKYIESWAAGALQLNQEVEIVVDNGALITVDGRWGLGQSVTHQAMERAIERASRHGVCVMGLRNSHHLGRVGHWAEQAMAAGFASIHFTNVASNWVVAPHLGAEARFVTNPFTVGLVRRGRPSLLLDFATSAIAHGKARVAYNKGVQVPPNSLIDHEGRPTSDPATLFESPAGALLTFAGHKGYALAMVCELLGGALTGGDTCRPGLPNVPPAVWNNMLAIVFDPARIGSLDAFEKEAAAFEDWVKSARLAPGADKIRMPGEPEAEARVARASGITIDAQTVAQCDAAAATVASRSGREVATLSSAAERAGASAGRSRGRSS
ncbi:MAG: malate/lactate/ureidoglycolate dehydrogenase [Burkholderiaceae bacterium]